MLYDILRNINNFIIVDNIFKDDVDDDEGIYIKFESDEYNFTEIILNSYNTVEFIIRATNDYQIHYDIAETSNFFIDFINNSFIPIKDLMMFTYDKKHIIDKQYFNFNNDVKSILKYLIKVNYAL